MEVWEIWKEFGSGNLEQEITGQAMALWDLSGTYLVWSQEISIRIFKGTQMAQEVYRGTYQAPGALL